MDNRVFIPKDKFDVAAVERLALARPEQIIGIERTLLEWIADIDWPVAKELIKILPKYHKEIVPTIVVLLSNPKEDIYLKISIVEHLLPRLPNDSFIELASVIEYMANINPKNEDELELKRVSIGRMAHINRINDFR